jgi:phosphoribosylanthranilate isomerase
VTVRVKICCIESHDAARAAAAAGADALGFVSAMPSGPGVIGEDRIAQIVAAAPRGPHKFLLTCATTADVIAAQVRRCHVDTVQLVDDVAPAQVARLRDLCAGLQVVQVIHVRGDIALAEAAAAAAHADALLLDSGDPAAARKVLGGTGRTHDWELSRRIRESVTVPVWLAGGLTPANVAAAVAAVAPYGVDVCSGVRTDGLLDEAKVAAFVQAARPRGPGHSPGGGGIFEI